MKIGFIGLGNLGNKLAASLIRNKCDLKVYDLNIRSAQSLLDKGAKWGKSPKILATTCDIIITCLPSPKVSAEVMEATDGILAGISPGKIWIEMSTTDQKEAIRLGSLIETKGGLALDCPVSGGCHRAATANISIFVGGARVCFEKALPILKIMGQRILHTGALGSASILKVVTNYLATANLIALCEALVISKAAGVDLSTAYQAIRISSGNSFVHETESQVILNGSRNINFTMELVLKDMNLFKSIADKAGISLEILPKLIEIFEDGQNRYGKNAWSPDIIRRLEEAAGINVIENGFPAEIEDDEKETEGYEINPTGIVSS